MSKILDALKKVSRQQSEVGEGEKGAITQADLSGAPGTRKTISSANPAFQNSMLIIVALIGMISLSFSVRVLSEMKQSNTSSMNVYNEFIAQKKRVDGLFVSLADLQTKQNLQADNVKSKFEILSASQKTTEGEIQKLIGAHNEFNGTLKDLKWTTQHLTEKLTSMSAELNNLKPNPN